MSSVRVFSRPLTTDVFYFRNKETARMSARRQLPQNVDAGSIQRGHHPCIQFNTVKYWKLALMLGNRTIW